MTGFAPRAWSFHPARPEFCGIQTTRRPWSFRTAKTPQPKKKRSFVFGPLHCRETPQAKAKLCFAFAQDPR
jgi:hypothetical protein